MNLAKALKHKNRLAGEISRLQKTFLSSNYKDSRLPAPPLNSSDAFIQLSEKTNELVVLKTKIAAANVGIFESIERMAQIKSLLAQVEALKADDIAAQKVDPYNKECVEKYVLTPYINSAEKENIRSSLQKRIEALQDEIDDYNAKTQI